MRALLTVAGLCISLTFTGCGDDAIPPDARVADGPLCTEDEACDDGMFCNGIERCRPDAAEADAFGCVAAQRGACREGQTCAETARSCTTECTVTEDADRDGARALECGGTDCDDADESRFPGADEVCDVDGHDEDCDPETFGFRDADDDGFPDARCCNGDSCGTDCDDSAPAIHPTSSELCNELDDDCDGATDERAGIRCWPDGDSDGYAARESEPIQACGTCGARQTAREPIEGAIDCDDAVASIHPGAADDQCDQLDNDCDGGTDEDATLASQRLFYADVDGDGFGDANDPGVLACAVALPGRALQPGDCDDVAPTTYPGAPELCNRFADDCASWPPGSTAAPARATEDQDSDGAAPVVATCAGGPLPAIDCADTDATRLHCTPERRAIASERFERVRVGDVDDDGDADIVASSQGAIVAFRNDGGGASFTREAIDGTTARPGFAPSALALADVDADGDLDVLSQGTSRDSGRLGWFERANETWTWHRIGTSSSDGFDASARPARDLDGDGLVEVVSADGSNLGIWHRVEGVWTRQSIATLPSAHPMFVALDGAFGIAVVSDARVRVFVNPGSISGTWVARDACAGPVDDLDAIDVEPDGDVDLAGLETTHLGLRAVVCSNPAPGTTWGLPTALVGSGSNLHSYADDVEAVDLDSDGDGDFVISGAADLLWFERRDDSFRRHVLTSDGEQAHPQFVATGDLDGDGDLDVVLSNSAALAAGQPNLAWYEMVGGAFSAP